LSKNQADGGGGGSKRLDNALNVTHLIGVVIIMTSMQILYKTGRTYFMNTCNFY